MKQWRHIFLKYLRYEHIVVVLRCLPSEEAVGLAILKKNRRSKWVQGHGSRSTWKFQMNIVGEWLHFES